MRTAKSIPRFGLLGPFVGAAATRLFAILMVVLALATASSGKEANIPSELEMRLAFQAYLSAQVQDVLYFVFVTKGPDGLARERNAHADRFEIRSFSLSRCERSERIASHLCTFSVDVETFKGAIERTVTGCFVPASKNRLVYLPKSMQRTPSANDQAAAC